MYEQYLHGHGATIIIQDDMPLVSSAEVLPETQPHSIMKAEGSAINKNTTAQRNTVGQI